MDVVIHPVALKVDFYDVVINTAIRSVTDFSQQAGNFRVETAVRYGVRVVVFTFHGKRLILLDYLVR